MEKSAVCELLGNSLHKGDVSREVRYCMAALPPVALSRVPKSTSENVVCLPTSHLEGKLSRTTGMGFRSVLCPTPSSFRLSCLQMPGSEILFHQKIFAQKRWCSELEPSRALPPGSLLHFHACGIVRVCLSPTPTAGGSERAETQLRAP